MSFSCSDAVDSLSRMLDQKGYRIHNGDAETGGEVVDDESGEDWWFTLTQGGDVEAGETCDTELGATVDAMEHWFRNSTLVGATPTAPAEAGPALKSYVVLHTHKHGGDTYLFRSQRADVPTGWFGEDTDLDDEDSTLSQLCEAVGIDFEPHRGETLDITQLPDTAPVF